MKLQERSGAGSSLSKAAAHKRGYLDSIVNYGPMAVVQCLRHHRARSRAPRPNHTSSCTTATISRADVNSILIRYSGCSFVGGSGSSATK